MLKTTHLRYEKNGKALIVDISLSFSPGLLHAVLGPNGAGKTTFLKLLAGIWKPSHGTIYWNKDQFHHYTRKVMSQTVSFVPQHYPVSFDFRADELVGMGRYAWSEQRRHSAPIIEKALKQVDAWHLRERPVTELSQGERQRIYIARALATESPVLLLDEPTASLDIRHQIEIWTLLRELAGQGKVIIVTLHDLDATNHFCDRVAVLDRGHCIANGAPDEVLDDVILKQVFGVARHDAPQSFKLA